jgi:hypothetical protein
MISQTCVNVVGDDGDDDDDDDDDTNFSACHSFIILWHTPVQSVTMCHMTDFMFETDPSATVGKYYKNLREPIFDSRLWSSFTPSLRNVSV